MLPKLFIFFLLFIFMFMYYFIFISSQLFTFSRFRYTFSCLYCYILVFVTFVYFFHDTFLIIQISFNICRYTFIFYWLLALHIVKTSILILLINYLCPFLTKRNFIHQNPSKINSLFWSEMKFSLPLLFIFSVNIYKTSMLCLF